MIPKSEIKNAPPVGMKAQAAEHHKTNTKMNDNKFLRKIKPVYLDAPPSSTGQFICANSQVFGHHALMLSEHKQRILSRTKAGVPSE